MTDEQTPSGQGTQTDLDLAEATVRLAELSAGLIFRFGAPEALKLLMQNSLGLALKALPVAEVSRWMRTTADNLEKPQGTAH